MATRYVPKTIHTANMSGFQAAPQAPMVQPFITLAQQIGAERPSLAQRVSEALTAADPAGLPWSAWDRELVQKVSQDSNIPAELIDSLESSGHSWLDDLLNGIAGRVDEMRVFHRVRDAVRHLAQRGRVVLIGHGSAYFTRDLPGGLHVRLVAPLPHRISTVAAKLNLSPPEAARRMRRLDRQRRDFFSRFGLTQPLAPEMFSAVFNVDSIDEASLSRAIIDLLPQGNRHAPSRQMSR